MDNENKTDGALSVSDVMRSQKSRQFEVVEDTNFISLRCPDCNHVFGLLAVTTDMFENINMRFTCPYCSNTHGVK